jgi:copper homeostasis protein
MPGVVLEVAVGDPRDVPGAAEGGGDRLHVALPGPACGLSPEPALVSAICRESDLPVFVLLRLNDSWSTTGGEFARLVGLGEDYVACGATGVAFGFLDADLEIDTEVCAHLAERLSGVPWTFGRAVDDTLDARRSWRRLVGLPGLVAVRSAGSPRGIEAGYDELLAVAGADPAYARLMMPGGGLLAEHVPWLARAGVRQFHLGPQARPGSSYKAYVDAAHVRSWRLLLDDALARMARSAG